MLASLVLALCALRSQAEGARKELPLPIPPGWELKRQEGASMIVPKDLPAGSVYNVVVPELTAKLGSLEALMASAKATFAETGAFKPGGEPARSRNEGGWEYLALIGTIEKNGRSILAQAVVLRKGDEEGMILVIADRLETLQKYSDAFSAMVRGVGAPPPAAATVVDLQFKSPEGWTTRKLEGGLLLEKTKSDFYENWAYRILILPSQPLEAPLRRTFAAAWAAFIKPTIETQIVPLPLVRRMKSGMAVAFDQDPSAKNKDGQVHHAGLYLLARGKRYVPILGLFHGLGNTAEVDKALTGIFESAVIPDAGDAPVAILDREDLVGNWNQSSYSMANYVTAAGAYAGDASIATLSYITLRPDGTVKKTFVALTAATRIREVDEGTWTLEDNLLVVNASSKTRKYRIFGAGADEKGGSFLVIAAYADTDQQADLSIPRRLFAGDWYRKEK